MVNLSHIMHLAVLIKWIKKIIFDSITSYWSNEKVAEHISNAYHVGSDPIKLDRFKNEVHSLTEELRSIYFC